MPKTKQQKRPRFAHSLTLPHPPPQPQHSPLDTTTSTHLTLLGLTLCFLLSAPELYAQQQQAILGRSDDFFFCQSLQQSSSASILPAPQQQHRNHQHQHQHMGFLSQVFYALLGIRRHGGNAHVASSSSSSGEKECLPLSVHSTRIHPHIYTRIRACTRLVRSKFDVNLRTAVSRSIDLSVFFPTRTKIIVGRPHCMCMDNTYM